MTLESVVTDALLTLHPVTIAAHAADPQCPRLVYRPATALLVI